MSIYLSVDLANELRDEREERERQAQQRAERLDVPIHFAGPGLNLIGLGNQPRHEKLLEEGLKGWAAIANRPIADRLASLRILVFEMIQDERVQVEAEHPLQVVLDNPGPIFSRQLLLMLTAWHLQAVGEAYWQKVSDGIGVTRQLWPIPPQNIAPVPGTENVIAGYEVRTGRGDTLFLPENEVVRIWRPDPSSIYSSIGVLGPQSVEWDAERFRMEHLRSHFKNDATPRVAIVGDSGAPAPEPGVRDAFAADWRNRYQGRIGRDRGLPAFIPPGFKPHEFSAHGGMVDLVPLGKAASEQFLAAYGVPGSIAGMMVDVNRAAAETAQFTMDQNTVLPIAMLVAGALEQQLAPDFDEGLLVSFEDFVASDKEFLLLRESQDAANKIRSGQQILRDRGEDPDEAPWAEFPVGSISDLPYTGEDPFESGQVLESADDLGPRFDTVEPSGYHELRLRDTRAFFSKERAFERVLQAEREFVPKYERAVAGVFEAQRQQLIKNLKKASGKLRIEDLFEELETLFIDRVLPLSMRAMEKSGTQAFDGLLRAEAKFALTKAMTTFLKKDAARTVKRINKATKAFLARELAQGVAAEESIDQIATRMNKRLRNRKRSRTIARTEIGKANQQGQLAGFEQTGVTSGKKWNTSLDDDVRDAHQIDDQERANGELFDLGFPSSSQAQHPLDPSLPPEDLINCRCFLTPVLDD